MIRLNKYLASAGVGSRRKCDDYIVAGRVSVNGEPVSKLGVKIDEENDEVCFDGAPVRPLTNDIYILLNKPEGIITTADDEKDRSTVLDLVTVEERIYPVGRLDQNTTGALILTNDGELTNKLIHPKYGFPKTYHVLLDKKLRPIDAYHFEHGILLDDKMTAPCKLTEVRVIDNCSFVEVILKEGRKRQIRRMFESLGYVVEKLDRIALGSITLRGLKRGEWRYLTNAEIHYLKSIE
jgi:pseudouridine synthase